MKAYKKKPLPELGKLHDPTDTSTDKAGSPQPLKTDTSPPVQGSSAPDSFYYQNHKY